MNGTKITMNPIRQVQKEIVDMLRGDEWMKAHRVTIVEQDAQGLRFLLEKSVGQIKGVVLVVGCDKFTNDFPALEVTTTITCIENVLTNRVSPDSATALDAVQAAIEIVDGEWWHFDECEHSAPEAGVLQATAFFRGLVKREQITTNNEE